MGKKKIKIKVEANIPENIEDFYKIYDDRMETSFQRLDEMEKQIKKFNEELSSMIFEIKNKIDDIIEED